MGLGNCIFPAKNMASLLGMNSWGPALEPCYMGKSTLKIDRSLGGVGFLLFFVGVVSGDYGKP